MRKLTGVVLVVFGVYWIIQTASTQMAGDYGSSVIAGIMAAAAIVGGVNLWQSARKQDDG